MYALSSDIFGIRSASRTYHRRIAHICRFAWCGVQLECGRTVNESLFSRRDKNHTTSHQKINKERKLERKMKNKRWKNHFRMESKSKSKKKRENRHTKNGVFCNIYEMISLAYLQCNMVAGARCNAERKNEIEKKRKCATQTRVSSSEQVFQFILALECVRASVIETSTDDDEDTTCRVCRLRCTHILHAILEILFIFVHPNSKSSRQSSVDDAIFGLLHSPHIVVDCLIYSLRYFIRFSRCVLFADW